ncbi:MAG TPA: hypothetical protein VKE69_09205 [Planctomycetota bacterium]|nr:hypothetical protein [Planctomycetota bacterium]
MVERPGFGRREERRDTPDDGLGRAIATTEPGSEHPRVDEPTRRPVSVDPMRGTDHYRLVVPFAPTPRGLEVEARAGV